ncbi:MAG: GNAT family N-acetyltransferase [Sciscionella sp.]|nr:GNAT family N-acetyltransferase [Sciscionella sp.]
MAGDGIVFGFAYVDDMPWDSYLRTLANLAAGVDLPDNWVPSTFLVADVGGEIVGRASIRHRLSPVLSRRGGHIGYCVLPRFRRRGYATEMLRKCILLAREIGITEALLITCDADNIGSIRVIEANGGQLESTTTVDETPVRRYLID